MIKKFLYTELDVIQFKTEEQGLLAQMIRK